MPLRNLVARFNRSEGFVILPGVSCLAESGMLWKLQLPEHRAQDVTSCRLDQVTNDPTGLNALARFSTSRAP
jgi:hypothetical protein